MKYILIIGDGMADEPVPELGGKTPLQYAKIPMMDALASAGELGSVLTIPEGVPPGSDTAILSIFGCDPRICYAGRAPLEAAASGIIIPSGDVAYRCNMVTFEDAAPGAQGAGSQDAGSQDAGAGLEYKKLISHSAGAIDGDESDAIIKALFDTPVFRDAAREAGLSVYPASSFRHIAVQKHADIGGLRLTEPHNHLGETVGPLLPRGGENAAVLEKLMRLAHGALDAHPLNAARRAAGKLPANGVWFWAEGMSVALPDFRDRYGKTGSVVSAVPLCRGIGMLIGLDGVVVDGATGELNTNYEGKAEAALKILETKDFAAIHVEAPDECTHDGDTKGKLQAIEWIDSRVIAPIAESLGKSNIDYRMLVLSDHRTLTSTRGHDGGPVPYILYDSRVDRRGGVSYCEEDAGKEKTVGDGTLLMDMLFEDAR